MNIRCPLPKVFFVFSFFFLNFLLLFLVGSHKVKAQNATVNCDAWQSGWTRADCDALETTGVCYDTDWWEQEMGGPVCYCQFTVTCDKPANICCQPGVSCYNDYPWRYYYNPVCINAVLEERGPRGQCSWSWEDCGAYDSCISPPYLEAGLCSSSGCAVGGDYKTCCSGTTVVNCTGGQFMGVCPEGSTTVQCGFPGAAGGLTCGAAACSAGVTPTPGGPTPTPGGPTPTPAPVICSDDAWVAGKGCTYDKPQCSNNTDCSVSHACPAGSWPTDYVCSGGCCVPGREDRHNYNFDVWLNARNVTRNPNGDFSQTVQASPGDQIELGNGYINRGECVWWGTYVINFNWRKEEPPNTYDTLLEGATFDRAVTNTIIDGYCRAVTGSDIGCGRAGNYHCTGLTNCRGYGYVQDGYHTSRCEDPDIWKCQEGYRWREVACEDNEDGGVDGGDQVSNAVFVTIRPDADRDIKVIGFVPRKDGSGPWVSPEVLIDVQPVCTVSLSPDPLTVQEGGSSSLVATVTGTVSRVDFSSSDTRYATVNPSSDTTLSYSTTVSGVSRGSATLTARAYDAGETLRCRDDSSVTVTSPGPWFQTQGGDVHGEGGVSSPIPSTATNRIFSLDLDGYPGVVSYGPGANYDFRAGTGQGEDLVSSTGWLANSSYSLPYSYAWFYDKFGSPTSPAFSCDPGCPSPTSGGTTVYYASGDVAINQDWVIPGSGTKVVVFVHGDLTINGQANREVIDVPEGSFLAFIASGDINITGRVGDKRAATDEHHLQGVYIADGQIKTNSDDDPSGRRLVAAGLFYARDGFDLGRDLGSTGSVKNSLYPAEFFIFRPDLVINSPRELWVSKMSWQEVAP